MTPDDHGITRKVRIVSILHAAEAAGQRQVERHWLHAVAYLSNVLSPMWEAVPLVSEMLKTDGAPYDPALQRSLEALVGSGLVNVHDARLEETQAGRWDIDASYSLRYPQADGIVDGLRRYPDEVRAESAIREIFLILAGLPADTADKILRLDATYNDPRVGVDALVRLIGDDESNATTEVTRRFATVAPSSLALSTLDEIGLYLVHLQNLAEAAG